MNKIIFPFYILAILSLNACTTNDTESVVVEERGNESSKNDIQKDINKDTNKDINKDTNDKGVPKIAIKDKKGKDIDKNRQYAINAKTQQGNIAFGNSTDGKKLNTNDGSEENLSAALAKDKNNAQNEQANKSDQATDSKTERNADGTLTPAQAAQLSADISASQLVFYFNYDSSKIDKTAKAELIKHAKRMQQNKHLKLRIEGHTDERGSRSYNLALGENRATAVKSIIALYGVDNQIDVISYGEEKPANAGHDKAAWKHNRRVELIFY